MINYDYINVNDIEGAQPKKMMGVSDLVIYDSVHG
jgi:hypothetical protein